MEKVICRNKKYLPIKKYLRAPEADMYGYQQ